MKAMKDGVNDAEMGYEDDFDTFAGGLTPEKPAEANAGDGRQTPAINARAQRDFDAAFDEQDDMEAEREVDDMREMAAAKKEEAMKPKTFKQAFADARKEGVKTFDWNGKKYTTDLAKPKASKPAAKVAEKPAMTGTKDTMPANPVKPEKKGMGPKLTMLPKEGALSIYDERKPVQQAGSGFEKQIPV